MFAQESVVNEKKEEEIAPAKFPRGCELGALQRRSESMVSKLYASARKHSITNQVFKSNLII